MNLELLREREDKGAGAVRELRPCEKWAALEVLAFDLGLRITQVNIVDEKVKAFKKELQGTPP